MELVIVHDLLGNVNVYVVSWRSSAYNLVTDNPNSEELKLSQEWGRVLSLDDCSRIV